MSKWLTATNVYTRQSIIINIITVRAANWWSRQSKMFLFMILSKTRRDTQCSSAFTAPVDGFLALFAFMADHALALRMFLLVSTWNVCRKMTSNKAK